MNEMNELRKLIKRANQRIVQSYKDNTNTIVIQKYNSTSQKFHSTNKNGIEKFTTSLKGLSSKDLNQLKSDVNAFLSDNTTKISITRPHGSFEERFEMMKAKTQSRQLTIEETKEAITNAFLVDKSKYIVEDDDGNIFYYNDDEFMAYRQMVGMDIFVKLHEPGKGIKGGNNRKRWEYRKRR